MKNSRFNLKVLPPEIPNGWLQSKIASVISVFFAGYLYHGRPKKASHSAFSWNERKKFLFVKGLAYIKFSVEEVAHFVSQFLSDPIEYEHVNYWHHQILKGMCETGPSAKFQLKKVDQKIYVYIYLNHSISVEKQLLTVTVTSSMRNAIEMIAWK